MFRVLVTSCKQQGSPTHQRLVTCSAIGMRRDAKVLVFQQPTDYILYNRIIDLLESSASCLNGNYMPSLDRAEDLLNANTSGGCALALLFLSDGKPSDQYGALYDECGLRMSLTVEQRHLLHAKKKISGMASKFGRRLTVTTIGFGVPGEDFAVLKAMCTAAEDYGSRSAYHASGLDVQALSTAIISYSSTLSSTMTECTEIGTGAARNVREVKRESNLNQFEHANDKTVDMTWVVHCEAIRVRATHVADYLSRIGVHTQGQIIQRKKFDAVSNNWRQVSQMTEGAVAVAMKEEIFGEGAERMVRISSV